MGVHELIGAKSEVRSAYQARAQQEALRTSERGRRAAASAAAFESAGGGLKGYYAGMHELQGKMPTVELGQVPGLNAEGVDFLMNLIEHHPAFEGKTFLPRRTQGALLKVINGETPQLNEQKLLQRIFGREVNYQNLRRTIQSMSKRHLAGEMINLPRSLMATLDQSMMFRHGIYTLAHSPRIWAKQFGPMYKALFSETSAAQWAENIQNFDTYALADKAGVQMTSMSAKRGDLSQREEQYMSVLAEQIPGLGRIVRASDRSYVGTLNAMRMGLFDKLVRHAAAEGWDLNDEHLLGSIGKFVNSATGRGDLGLLRKHAVTLQTVLFSPRLMASRFNFISPVYYHSLHPFARREALKALRNLVFGAGTVLGAAHMAGAQVGIDPRSTDFGKMKFGNTRVDLLGGAQQPITLLATLFSGTRISSSTGLPEHLSGGAYGTSRFDVLWRYFQNKLAPVSAGTVEALQQQDPATHQPLGMAQFGLPDFQHPGRAISKNFWLNHTVPLLIQDIASLPGAEKYYLSPLAGLGIGTQNYGAPPKGQHYQDKLTSDSLKAGLGKPPPDVLRDAHWKGALDNKIAPGMSNYDKMKAAAELFDQRYGSNVAPSFEAAATTDAAAKKAYEELRAKLTPSYDRWSAVTSKVLNAQQGAKPTPAAPPPPQKSSAPATAPAMQDVSYHIPAKAGGGGGGLPPELGSAIQQAAAKYGVPAETLAGIWRIESGSTYPNPAVNSSGYGGLFGTTKWNASTQEQTDYAASTLRHLLNTHGGNMAAALHAYSGGGYSSVSGAGGAWHQGGAASRMPLGASGSAVTGLGAWGAAMGPSAAGDGVDAVLRQMEQQLAAGRYNPSEFLTQTLHALSTQPLQGNVQGINFELPKGGKAAAAARGAIRLAEHYLGTPYAWGGSTPGGFDCSGLLQYIYARMGVQIPRTSQTQFEAGRRVSRGQLRAGDAVFFTGSDGTRSAPGHVGIYIGGGRFIEAPHTGTTVRVSNLNGYPGYVGARRFSR
jgi:cell wall-associated NlpC family hydrolase